MVINHNLSAMNANRNMNINANAMSSSMEKLSSGLRINRAGDDAAGLAISEKMRAQIRGLDQASTNAEDGISLVQTAEGALSQTQDILQRMRELADQAANGTNTDEDRAQIQKEVDQLTEEVDDIANNTSFNTQSLLDGGTTQDSETIKKDDIDTTDIVAELESEGYSEDQITNSIEDIEYKTGGSVDLTFQVGANEGETMDLTIGNMDAESLNIKSTKITSQEKSKEVEYDDDEDGITDRTETETYVELTAERSSLDVTTQEGASSAISVYDAAINSVSSQRAVLGAVQNRLEYTVSNLDTSSENLTSAESRIRDVDMASEMMEYSKYSILQQASQAMLAQANQSTSGVLQLLQ